VAQTVTVKGVDDAEDDGDTPYTIVLEPETTNALDLSTLDVSGTQVQGVSVTNLDNDDPTPPAPPSPLPYPLSNRDVGRVGVRGGGAYSDGTWLIRGSGTNIYSNADGFHFVYRALKGDGTLVARVTSIENTHYRAKAGLMIRKGLGAGAKHAMVAVTPGGGVEFLRRRLSGAQTAESKSVAAAVPLWLKLVRTGNIFIASTSQDGVNWMEIGRDSFDMPRTVYFGLVVSSLNNSVLNTATFDNVTVIGVEGVRKPKPPAKR
jgi:regulation of enolase protein 1 (concanavalin A-like superfamily)